MSSIKYELLVRAGEVTHLSLTASGGRTRVIRFENGVSEPVGDSAIIDELDRHADLKRYVEPATTRTVAKPTTTTATKPAPSVESNTAAVMEKATELVLENPPALETK